MLLNRKGLATALLTLPLSLNLTTAQADDGPASETPGWNDQVVVIASRYEQPLSQIGSSVSLLTDQDLLDGQYTFVVDALQTLPGISISQTGAFGGVASVNIRGAQGDRTKMMIDGIEVNDTSSPGGAFNFNSLDPFSVSRIEVLRGPQSILYGSNAIGGVINLITPSGEPGFGVNGFIEGGSFGTVRGGARIHGGIEKVFFNLSAVGSRTDGISAADEEDGNTEKDGHRNVTVDGKVTVVPTENSSLEFIVRYTDSDTETDGFGPADAPDSAEAEELTLAGRVKVDFFEGRFQNTLTVGHYEMDRVSNSSGFEFPGNGQRLNVDYLGVFKVNDAWTISAGYEHDKSEAKTVTEEKFTINSFFGEVGFTGVEGLTLTAGVRHDDHNAYGGSTVARVTGSYAIPGTGTRIKGSWGEGFKAPSVFQLTYICTFCGLTEPNTDLAPEKSDAWEIGVEQFVFDDKLRLSLTYFDQRIDDLIIFTFTAGYDNVDRTRSQGVEFELDAAITDTLRLIANYTYTDARDRDTNDPIIRTPEHLASIQLNWQATDKFQTGLYVLYNGEATDFGGTPLDDFIRVDLTASYAIDETLTIYGRIDNLFDEQYQYVNGYGTPGISAFGGVRATF